MFVPRKVGRELRPHRETTDESIVQMWKGQGTASFSLPPDFTGLFGASHCCAEWEGAARSLPNCCRYQLHHSEQGRMSRSVSLCCWDKSPQVYQPKAIPKSSRGQKSKSTKSVVLKFLLETMGNLLSCFSWSLEAVFAPWLEVPSSTVLDITLFNLSFHTHFFISPLSFYSMPPFCNYI